MAFSKSKISTIDMHTCGEPLRIVVDGLPDIPGKTILDKRTYARENLDHIRRFLMFEPRGHADMYGCYLVEKDLPAADVAVLFLHNEGYSTMCGHAVLALARFAVDHSYVAAVAEQAETPVNIQCPCGLVRAFVEYNTETKKTGRARFQSVPAFILESDIYVEVAGFGEGASPGDQNSTGKVLLDVSYGGAFYALVDAKQVGLDVRTSSVDALKGAAKAIKAAVQSSVSIKHPFSPELSFLYGVIFTDGKDAWDEHQPTANVCIFADGEVDRAPTGSGVTARLAAQYHKRQIALMSSREFIQPQVLGSSFTGKVVEETQYGGKPAVIVEVAGNAHYTGTSVFELEEGDVIGQGFLI